MTRAELRAECPSNYTGDYIEWLEARVLELTAMVEEFVERAANRSTLLSDTLQKLAAAEARIAELTANEAPRQTAENIVSEYVRQLEHPVWGEDNIPEIDDNLRSAITTAIQAASNAQLERGRANDIRQYNERQRQWSRKTFGDGKRTLGILNHIRKELAEIEAKPDDLEEWIDVVILALDGYWRHGGRPADLMMHLQAKQDKNFARMWPVPGPEDEPMEHVRDAL
jgi:hypothetical protein